MARCCGAALLSAALLLLAATGLDSAPAPTSPEPPGSPDIDRYLYDDTDGLFFFDVKAALRVPAVKALMANPALTAAANQDAVSRVLAECGVSVARDVDRVVVIAAPSCRPAGSADANGLTLVQGRFNTAQLRQKLAGLVRTGKVEELAVPRGKIYRVKEGKSGGYLALLDSSTIAQAATKQAAADAVARAGTNRRPTLKDKQLARFVKAAKPGVPLQAMLLDSFVVTPAGPGGKPGTVAAGKISRVLVRVESDNKQVRTLVDLTCKTAADADNITNQVQAVLTLLPQGLKGNPQLAPAVTLAESIKVKSEGTSCVVESKVDQKALADAVEAMIKMAQ